MADIITRAAEGCDADPFLLWDSVWDSSSGVADWALAGRDDTLNTGGLRAKAGLDTAVILALFTDRRVDPAHPLFYLCDGNPGGYFGDGVDVRDDLGEGPLGSLLWLLERAPLTLPGGIPVETFAEQMTREALLPLQAQGAAVRIDVSAVANRLASRLEITVNMYGRDGLAVYSRKFETLWNQVAR
jgi:phage gp46-like protein